MIVPQSLKQGDRVAIVSPAGTVLPQRVDGAERALAKLGFVPVEGRHCRGSVRLTCGDSVFSGTIDERLEDLHSAFADDEVKAILCSRGGYGMIQLLEHLDFDLIARNPKWVIGFSDISALHAAMLHAGVMSLHAPMAKHLTEHGTEDRCSRYMIDVLTGKPLPDYRIDAHELNREGEAEATIAGGNLAVLSALTGTQFNIIKPGTILFIEDIGEEIYRVQRMLYALRLNGVLPSLAGLVVGQFTNYHKPTAGGCDMYAMISDMVAPYGYPVIFNFPVGHIDYNVPIVEGARAKIKVTSTEATLKIIL